MRKSCRLDPLSRWIGPGWRTVSMSDRPASSVAGSVLGEGAVSRMFPVS